MCSSSITQAALMPVALPEIGREYEVAGDGGVWHNGHLLTGVLLNEDGAWAGRIRYDASGPFLDLVDADGDFVPAHNNWDTCIVGTLAGVVATPAPAVAA